MDDIARQVQDADARLCDPFVMHLNRRRHRFEQVEGDGGYSASSGVGGRSGYVAEIYDLKRSISFHKKEAYRFERLDWRFSVALHLSFR